MNNDKIRKAIEIFKEKLPDAKGKFGARPSQTSGNEVEITSDGILYCTVNILSGLVKGI